jgi:hypothetical protein
LGLSPYLVAKLKPTAVKRLFVEEFSTQRRRNSWCYSVGRSHRSPAAVTTTNANGEFFILLAPGEYSLKVSARGFAETLQVVNLKPDTAGSLDISLKLAPSQAIVTITPEVVTLQMQFPLLPRPFTSLRDVPQAITVVTAEQIQGSVAASIADVVAYVRESRRTRERTIETNW